MSDTSNTGETADLETAPEAAAEAPAPSAEDIIRRLETEK
jgi:hypothetical protein